MASLIDTGLAAVTTSRDAVQHRRDRGHHDGPSARIVPGGFLAPAATTRCRVASRPGTV